jgi:hypothetical protein
MLVWGGYENPSPFILLNTGGATVRLRGKNCNGVDDDCDGAADDGAMRCARRQSVHGRLVQW